LLSTFLLLGLTQNLSRLTLAGLLGSMLPHVLFPESLHSGNQYAAFIYEYVHAVMLPVGGYLSWNGLRFEGSEPTGASQSNNNASSTAKNLKRNGHDVANRVRRIGTHIARDSAPQVSPPRTPIEHDE